MGKKVKIENWLIKYGRRLLRMWIVLQWNWPGIKSNWANVKMLCNWDLLKGQEIIEK